MKNPLLTLLVLTGLCTAPASGQHTAPYPVQQKGFQATARYQVSTNRPYSAQYDFSSVDFMLAPEYAFNNWLSVRVPFTVACELYRTPTQTFDRPLLIGGTVACDFLSNGVLTLGIEGSIGGTVTASIRKYVYYDGGFFFHLGRRTKFSIGLGYRYYQSNRTAGQSYHTMYAGIGIRFN